MKCKRKMFKQKMRYTGSISFPFLMFFVYRFVLLLLSSRFRFFFGFGNHGSNVHARNNSKHIVSTSLYHIYVSASPWSKQPLGKGRLSRCCLCCASANQWTFQERVTALMMNCHCQAGWIRFCADLLSHYGHHGSWWHSVEIVKR